MIDITNEAVLSVVALDAIARGVLSDAVSGVSVGNNSRIHVVTDTTSNRNKAGKIMDNWGNLNPSPSVASMTVGDSDPDITISSADDDLGYVILDGEKLYASGTVEVVTGTATLTLSSPEAGVYTIYFYRMQGNFASGSTQITVNEA